MSEELEFLPVVSRQHKSAMTKSAELWKDWQIEIVSVEWPKGKLSAFQIGGLIGKSRNAVIGKAHRLGLGARRIRGANQHMTANGERKKKPSELKRAPKREAEMSTKPKLPTRIPEVIIGTGVPIAIGALTDSTCKAPAGYGPDGLMIYCGDATFMGKPFCEGHCALFYAPPRPRHGGR